MPGVDGDWISEPLSVVDNCLKQSTPSDYGLKVSAFFTKNVAESEESKHWIPSLNCTPMHELKPNSLVRMRCMVQDMFGPEYYYDVFEAEGASAGEITLQSGRYKDVTDKVSISHTSSNNKMSERHVFYCVPVPAECSWVKQGHKSVCLSPRMAGSSNTAPKVKRSLDEDDMEVHDAVSSEQEPNKRTRSENISASSARTSQSQINTPLSMNHPLPDERGAVALVKLYDGLGDSIKLNDIIDVCGVISTDPSLAHLDDVEREMMFCEEERKVHHPPSSLVPRLHAVHVTKLQTTNPLVRPASLTKQVESVQSECKEVRENLLSILEHALGGDTLAAEYLLCHLLSSVYVRKDSMAVGKMSLNLTRIPAAGSSLISCLLQILGNFLTNLHYLPLTLDNMNKLKFVPVKDYEANRLNSGILQLPNGVHLVLDETAMCNGQLDVNGVKNLTSLGQLIRWQTVSYDFKFHQQDFETDIPVLVLSEGKSLLPADIVVPIELTDTDIERRQEAINAFLSPLLVEKIRLYLTLAPTAQYEMGEDMSKQVQEDFVQMRQHGEEAITSEDFHNLLVLSRILALSYGLSDLNLDLWAKAKHMEELRKSRLSAHTD